MIEIYNSKEPQVAIHTMIDVNFEMRVLLMESHLSWLVELLAIQ